MKRVCTFLALIFVVSILASAADAHDAFKEPLEHRYNLKTVSCKSCHPDNKDRSIHNRFGMLFVEALKGSEMTKKFHEAEAKGEDAKKAYEKEMAKEFTKLLPIIEQKKITFKDLIEAGLMNGMRVAVPKEEKGKD